MTPGEELQPVTQLADAVTRQEPLVRPGVRDDEEGRLRQPQPLQTGDEIPTHLGQDLRRYPVENHADGGLAARGLLQRRPRRLVAVTRRGGDEEPQVGGLQQPAGQSPVGLVHGVQVRGIDQGQAGRNGSGDLLPADLGQRVLGQRVHILRIGHQDRGSSGGPEYSGD